MVARALHRRDYRLLAGLALVVWALATFGAGSLLFGLVLVIIFWGMK